jgi:GNAT superfamily N-acetyltransferase
MKAASARARSLATATSRFLLFPEVYESLDPGEAVTARDSQTGEVLGVCFSHERETHVAIGIVATAPEAGGRGIAKQMMTAVLEKARNLGKPARLVSSLLNLDSFSLYTRLGFVPRRDFSRHAHHRAGERHDRRRANGIESRA